MDIIGKIIAVLELRSGVAKSSGNPWMTQEYVLETEEQYPTKIVFGIFGEDKIQQAAIKVGDRLKVSFDINAREFNGRWYNDIRAWKVEHDTRVQSNAAPAAAAAPAASPAPTAQPTSPVAPPPDPLAPGNTPDDELPFD